MVEERSITLEGHFEEFARQKVAEGKYEDVSDVIRAGLQILEEEEKKSQILRNAIRDGIDSNVDMTFGPTMHLRELKKMKSLNE